MVDAISTHALREEGDERYEIKAFWQENFYPRPPRGGRPQGDNCKKGLLRISTHALREEGDLHGGCNDQAIRNFYPRPPRGGRHVQPDLRKGGVLFLPTPSARRATMVHLTLL